MAIPTDWQDFLINHPWAPPRLLMAKYDIKRHDLDNWRRNNPSAHLLDPDSWRLSLDKPPPTILKIMRAAWKYYLEEEIQIQPDSRDAVPKLIRLKTPKPPFQFLVDGRYLGRLPGYASWIADGYTRLSFAVCNIWPGRAVADQQNLLPALFLQTKQTAVRRQDAVGLVKHIYLCFLGPSVSDDLDELKRRFVLRHRENGFITAAVLRQYGMSALHLNRHGVPELVRAVAREFADELGLETKPATQWIAEAFRRDNEDTDWTLCRYCGRKPVDLHHHLLRSEYPELTYDAENVVPLCVSVHAAITRNMLSDDFQRAYAQAEKAWRKSDPGSRVSRFDDVLSLAHRETIGFPTTEA